MNWGYKILVTLILFVAGMLFMLYLAMNQTNEMLDENYYVLEQQYQGLIDANQVLEEALKEPLVQQNAQELSFHLPENTFGNIQDGVVELIRPDNQSLDASFPLTPDSLGVFSIDKETIVRGIYKIRVKWTNDDQTYYSDKNLFVE